MRIGTWNLAGRWSVDHRQFIENEACDVWLLTEVSNGLSFDGGTLSRSSAMSQKKAWAAVWSKAIPGKSSSPHPAAAAVILDGILMCSCVLPWRGARSYWPPEDHGDNIAAITTAALRRLKAGLQAGPGPIVWGGDWNHALHGPEYAGTSDGRRSITRLVAELDLRVPTENLEHAIPGLLSIDHIAVPARWRFTDCRRVVAAAAGKRLSDHDAYILDARP